MAGNDIKHKHSLSIADLIAKKRDNLELEPDEIKQFIDGLSNGDVQDCHVGAMLMAIYLNGNLTNSFFLLFIH
jgi:thymidine phosphorylase